LAIVMSAIMIAWRLRSLRPACITGHESLARGMMK
jgi:hypothetical protein